MNSEWSRNDKLALYTLLIAIVGVVVALFIPEFRHMLGLNSEPSLASSSSSYKNTPSPESSAPATITSSVSSKPDNPMPISVPFLGYANANWNQYGPGYDGTDVNHVTSLWMRASGYITYQVSLPETKRNLIVSAQLSSELEKTYSTNPSDASDVTLIVNGKNQGMRTVVPDNGVGMEYQWIVPNNILRVGNNEITFKVGEGKYRNGITFFKPLQLRFQ